MTEQLTAIQQAIAMSLTPATTFEDLPQEQKREVFFHLPEMVQELLVADMSREQLRAFVRGLDPDEGTDVLGLADEQTRERVLRQLTANRREKIGFLLEFDPESAAGLMDLNYVTVAPNTRFPDVAYEEIGSERSGLAIDGDIDERSVDPRVRKHQLFGPRSISVHRGMEMLEVSEIPPDDDEVNEFVVNLPEISDDASRVIQNFERPRPLGAGGESSFRGSKTEVISGYREPARCCVAAMSTTFTILRLPSQTPVARTAKSSTASSSLSVFD